MEGVALWRAAGAQQPKPRRASTPPALAKSVTRGAHVLSSTAQQTVAADEAGRPGLRPALAASHAERWCWANGTLAALLIDVQSESTDSQVSYGFNLD